LVNGPGPRHEVRKAIPPPSSVFLFSMPGQF
jgi:hypothetical protein